MNKFHFLQNVPFFNHTFYLQMKSNSWSKTIINYSTEKPTRLPIIDIAVRDIGTAEAEFSIEIGDICYRD